MGLDPTAPNTAALPENSYSFSLMIMLHFWLGKNTKQNQHPPKKNQQPLSNKTQTNQPKPQKKSHNHKNHSGQYRIRLLPSTTLRIIHLICQKINLDF